MRVLLDTHAFLWFVWNDKKLTHHARTLIEDAANNIYLSAASVWEIGIKVGTGKLSVGQDVKIFLTEHLIKNQISLLPITIPHAALIATLPQHHKDPFDRLLVAQSLVEDMPLISIDTPFDAYGVQRFWDSPILNP